MDNSETYIKMSDFEDIQTLAELLSLESKQGSMFVKADDHSVIVWAANMITTPPAIKFIRLFRQDQLQAMIGSDWVKTFEEFAYFANDNCADEWSFENELGYGSMEQLWLAFVMFQLYHKKWENEEWIELK